MSGMPASESNVLSYAPARGSIRAAAWRYVREMSVLGAYLILLLLLAMFSPRYFEHQFAASLVESMPVLVAAVGMTLIILARQIDISIGSQFSVCAIVAALLSQAGLPMSAVAICTILCGAIMGAFNGVFVALLGLPSIVVTLATMVILAQSLALARTGAGVSTPPGFQWFGNSQRTGEMTLLATALVIFAALAWGLRWLAAGRAVYAVGSDQEAARLAGVRPRRVVFTIFTLMGLLTAVAALLNTVKLVEVYPNTGQGKELEVIAAVVVGGVAITGGRGTLLGTLFGVLLLGAIGSGLAFLGVKPERTRAIHGAIILLSVSVEGMIPLLSSARLRKRRAT
jgi:rhamnose transport system permease protein